MVVIVLCNELDTSNTKITITSADEITTMIPRYLMLATGACENVNPTLSSTDDKSEQVLE